MPFGQYYPEDPGERIAKALVGFGATILELRQMYDYLRIREQEYEDAMRRHAAEMEYRRSSLVGELYSRGVKVDVDENLRLRGEPEFVQTPAEKVAERREKFERSSTEAELLARGVEAKFTPEGELAEKPRLIGTRGSVVPAVKALSQLLAQDRDLAVAIGAFDIMPDSESKATAQELRKQQAEIRRLVDLVRGEIEAAAPQAPPAAVPGARTIDEILREAYEAYATAIGSGEKPEEAAARAREILESIGGVAPEDIEKVVEEISRRVGAK